MIEDLSMSTMARLLPAGASTGVRVVRSSRVSADV
jgi:hypothetical protein